MKRFLKIISNPRSHKSEENKQPKSYLMLNAILKYEVQFFCRELKLLFSLDVDY